MKPLSPAMIAELRRFPLVGNARPSFKEGSALALVRRGLLNMREEHVVRRRYVWADRDGQTTEFDPPQITREFWVTQEGARVLRELEPAS